MGSCGIRITDLKCSNLKNADLIGKSDPYVVAFALSSKPRKEFRTITIDNNLNPHWPELDWSIPVKDFFDTVCFEVYDEDTVGSDDLLGKAKLHVADDPDLCAQRGSPWLPRVRLPFLNGAQGEISFLLDISSSFGQPLGQPKRFDLQTTAFTGSQSCPGSTCCFACCGTISCTTYRYHLLKTCSQGAKDILERTFLVYCDDEEGKCWQEGFLFGSGPYGYMGGEPERFTNPCRAAAHIGAISPSSYNNAVTSPPYYFCTLTESVRSVPNASLRCQGIRSVDQYREWHPALVIEPVVFFRDDLATPAPPLHGTLSTTLSNSQGSRQQQGEDTPGRAGPGICCPCCSEAKTFCPQDFTVYHGLVACASAPFSSSSSGGKRVCDRPYCQKAKEQQLIDPLGGGAFIAKINPRKLSTEVSPAGAAAVVHKCVAARDPFLAVAAAVAATGATTTTGEEVPLTEELSEQRCPKVMEIDWPPRDLTGRRGMKEKFCRDLHGVLLSSSIQFRRPSVIAEELVVATAAAVYPTCRLVDENNSRVVNGDKTLLSQSKYFICGQCPPRKGARDGAPRSCPLSSCDLKGNRIYAINPNRELTLCAAARHSGLVGVVQVVIHGAIRQDNLSSSIPVDRNGIKACSSWGNSKAYAARVSFEKTVLSVVRDDFSTNPEEDCL